MKFTFVAVLMLLVLTSCATKKGHVHDEAHHAEHGHDKEHIHVGGAKMDHSHDDAHHHSHDHKAHHPDHDEDMKKKKK